VSVLSQLDGRPSFRPDRATELLRAWHVTGTVTELDSERDQNWLVDDRYVLKVANRHDATDVLDLQQSMMRRLAAAGLPCPGIVRTTDGARWVAADGHLAWLITYLPGRRLTEVAGPSPALLRDIGEIVGRTTVALDGFDHPAAHRLLQWDVACADRVISRYRHEVTDPGQRRILERALARYRSDVMPLLDRLPRSVIHNDANDHNVLVSGEIVTGLLDFGDAVHSLTVNDLAVACAYAMLDQPDPVAVAGHLRDGYSRHRTLDPLERRVLPHLIRTRLATSVAISAHQRAIHPGNAYLTVSEGPAWRLLAQLDEGNVME
jgi:Ser/Thr protein kinase RdoA (MazF antagonist)